MHKGGHPIDILGLCLHAGLWTGTGSGACACGPGLRLSVCGYDDSLSVGTKFELPLVNSS